MRSDVTINARIMAERSRLRALTGGKRSLAEEPMMSDEDVIAGLLAGRQRAAEVLFDRVHGPVDRTLRRILQASDSDHEDLLQITLERIIRTLVERRFTHACSLATWASAIAGHVGIDALRSRIRARSVFEGDASPEARGVPGHSLDRQLEARSDVEQLQGILADMNAKQAETVVLHDLFGHELSEIAVLMGVSLAATQSRLVRGRKDLLRRARARLTRGL